MTFTPAQAAHEYARLGWRIVPCATYDDAGRCTCGSECKSPGKHPNGRLARHGLKDATSDEATVTNWWRRDPNANIAIVVPEGFVVLDVDAPEGHQHDGVAALAQLVATHEALPDTLVMRTGGGGTHYWFRLPDGMKHGNSTGDLPKGIDVRGSGSGYVMVPPSKHRSGRPYEWQADPDPARVAPIPQWLLDLLKPQRRQAERQPSAAPPRSIPQVHSGAPETEVARIRHALGYIPADDRELWVEIGQALQGWGGPDAYNLWYDWSTASPKFDASDADRVWRSFHGEGRNLGTVFAHAKDYGWEPSIAPKPPKKKGSKGSHLRVVGEDEGGDAAGGGGGRPDRDAVVLRGDLEDRARIVIDWLEDRQRRDGWQLFQRGGALVRVAPRRDGVHVEPIDTERFIEHCTSRARFYVHKDEPELIDFPPRLASYILAKPSWRAVPAVETVYRCPVVAPDGSLVIDNGYHEALEAWVDVGDLEVPPVPGDPTKEELAHARHLIEEELLGDFAFDTQASRANAIAFALLPFVRPLVRCPSPLYIFSAPTEGSGKGLLSTVLTEASTGREPVSMSESRDDDEWRKRITSTLAQAPSCIRIDNVNRKLDTGALASVLTSTWWTDRALGRSENVTYRNDAVWSLTANNPNLSPELGRRSCWIRLLPDCERPAERQGFRHADLRTWARENRGALVWAFLVLVANWRSNGELPSSLVMGSYEDWARIVGGILSAAGIDGFMANRDAGYKQSGADAAEWRAFFEAWWTRHRDGSLGVKDLVELATKEGLLDDVLGDGGDRSQRTRLGKALGKRVDRITELFQRAYGAMSAKLAVTQDRKVKVAMYQLVRMVPTGAAGNGAGGATQQGDGAGTAVAAGHPEARRDVSGTLDFGSPASQPGAAKTEFGRGGTCGTSSGTPTRVGAREDGAPLGAGGSGTTTAGGWNGAPKSAAPPENVPHVPPQAATQRDDGQNQAGHADSARPANVPPGGNVPPPRTTAPPPGGVPPNSPDRRSWDGSSSSDSGTLNADETKKEEEELEWI